MILIGCFKCCAIVRILHQRVQKKIFRTNAMLVLSNTGR